MNSKKIKSKNLRTEFGESIAQIVCLPEENKFRIYVAWENQAAAEDGFMGFYKSRVLFDDVNQHTIDQTMKYGLDISHLPECKIIFKALF